MAFVEMTCVQDMASPKPRFRIEARLGDERIVSEWVNEVTAEAFEKVLPEVIALVKRIDN